MCNNSGFLLNVEKKDGSWGQLVTALLLFLGIGLCIWEGLGLSGTGCSFLLPAAVGTAYCAVACKLPGHVKHVWLFQTAAAASMVIYSMIAGKYLICGWNASANAVFDMLELRIGYIFPRYEVSAVGLTPEICSAMFLVLPAVILGLLAAGTACGRKICQILIVVLIVGIAAIGVLGLYPPDRCWILLAAAILMLCIQSVAKKNLLPDTIKMSVVNAAVTATVLLVCCAALLFNDGGQDRAAENRRSGAAMIHSLRFETGRTTLPEGDFRKLSAFAPGDGIALTITLDQVKEAYKKEGLYLRGYVGEVYIGSGWIKTQPEQRAKYAELFAWLHERDFYGQSQYAQLCEALGISSKSSKDGYKDAGNYSTVTVDIKNACRGWRYVPYGAADTGADPRQIGDVCVLGKGLRGETEYTYKLSDVPVQEYEVMASLLTEAHFSGDPSALYYLESENAYRNFVYDTYLDVSGDAKKAISEIFRGLTLPKEGRVSFRDAQMVVSAYLSSIVDYNENPRTIDGKTDFVDGFFNVTKEGYSVHYATAAALMFRYLGIPARYAEGWYIPAETMLNIKDGEPVEIGQDFAHAWVEIYRDGVGFVPFEITPPYTDPMDQNNMAKGGSGGAEIPPEEEEKNTLTPLQSILIALLILLILLISAIAAAVIRRKIKRCKLASMLEAEDPSTAVSNMMTWAMELLKYMGISRESGSLYSLLPVVESKLGSETAIIYKNAVEKQQQALFSRDGADDAGRQILKCLIETLERELNNHKSRTQRLYLRWIKCVI